jgi:Universal stress protein family
VVRSGDPAAVILAVAEEVGADLIVMATHSGRELTRLLFGSVARTGSNCRPAAFRMLYQGKSFSRGSRLWIVVATIRTVRPLAVAKN